MMSRRVAALLCFGWLVPSAAHATIVIAMPEAELVRAADAIFVGTVLEVAAHLDEGGRIMTQAHIQVTRAVRGVKRNAVVTLEYPGGRLANGLAAFVDGTPKLAVGDRVFGFAERHAATLRPLGLRYGVLRVHGDGRGDEFVTRDTDGLVLVDRTGKPQSEGITQVRGVALEVLVKRVESHLRALGVVPGDDGVAR